MAESKDPVIAQGKANQNGSYSCLGRVTALEGTGQQVTDDVGLCVKKADVASITCKIWDMGSDPKSTTATQVSTGPSVVVANAIYDTLQTVGWNLDGDANGYNFRVDIGPTFIPTGAHWYQAEFVLTLQTGTVIVLLFRVYGVPNFTAGS